MLKLYFGPSAAGKDTLLRKDLRNGAIPIVTYTTRPPRQGEMNGVDYHFISNDEFIAMNKRNEFFETRKYETLVDGKKDIWWYGSKLIPDALDIEKMYVGVVDIDGIKAYAKSYAPLNIRAIYVYVPEAIREKRAKKRGSFDQTEWDRRAKDDRIKFSIDKLKELEEIPNLFIEYVDNY